MSIPTISPVMPPEQHIEPPPPASVQDATRVAQPPAPAEDTAPVEEVEAEHRAGPLSEQVAPSVPAAPPEGSAEHVSTSVTAPAPASAAPAASTSVPATSPAAPSVTIVQMGQVRTGPNLLLRALWFLFIGSWFGFLWAFTALLLEWTILGLPLAIVMFNRLPQVMTLKPHRTDVTDVTVVTQSGASTTVVVAPTRPAGQPFWLRAIYFLLVGWWFSLFWLIAAYLIGLTIIGLPLMFWMVNRIPALTTLSRL